MGFSMLGSLGCYISVKNSRPETAKLKSFAERDRLDFDIRFSKNKTYPAGILQCKRESKDFDMRSSPNEVRKEIEICYELIHRLGRGVVYLGSARVKSSHSHYLQAQELSREIANLLDCTTWSGAGLGLMDAVTRGAMQAGKPVGGIKIGKEAGEWTASKIHPYLPSENYHTCRFFSARKHGLVDAAVRNTVSNKTAMIALPGGIGTLDEIFEILALIQLKRIGSKLPVPFLVMNYDSFYSKLFEFLGVCEDWGTLSKGEVSELWKICTSNSEALEYLAKFYDLSYNLEKNEILF